MGVASAFGLGRAERRVVVEDWRAALQPPTVVVEAAAGVESIIEEGEASMGL